MHSCCHNTERGFEQGSCLWPAPATGSETCVWEAHCRTVTLRAHLLHEAGMQASPDMWVHTADSDYLPHAAAAAAAVNKSYGRANLLGCRRQAVRGSSHMQATAGSKARGRGSPGRRQRAGCGCRWQQQQQQGGWVGFSMSPKGQGSHNQPPQCHYMTDNNASSAHR